MLKQSQYWVLGAVVVLTLLLLNMPPAAAARLKAAVGALFTPLFGLTGSAHSFVDRASYAPLTRSTLISELERIRAENEQLRLAQAQSQEVLAENGRLRTMLNWQPRVPWKLRAANVIGREPTTWWRSVTIDYGTRDGAQVGQPVMTPAGLVGRIRETQLTQSQVALIGDPECGVSVVVSESRDQGIIQDARSAPVLDGLVFLRLLQNSPAVVAGQSVATSGLGGVFPPGIPVGQIVDTRSADGGLYTEARVRLAANLNQLEEVWVLP